MKNLTKVQKQALQNTADDLRGMVGEKYDMCIRCSHDHDSCLWRGGSTMKNFISDLRTAAKVFNQAKRARKRGAVLQVQETINLPVYKLGGWSATLEATLFPRETDQFVRNVFYGFAPNVQHDLLFTPESSGGWLARAQFWREQLRPTLPPDMFHAAMIRLCSHYRNIIIRRKKVGNHV